MAHDAESDGGGFGRPPKRTQFKKGASGNPRGRPKNVSNFKTDLAAELQEKLVLTENGKERRSLRMGGNAIQAMSLSRDGHTLACLFQDLQGMSLRFVDPETRKES